MIRDVRDFFREAIFIVLSLTIILVPIRIEGEIKLAVDEGNVGVHAFVVRRGE